MIAVSALPAYIYCPRKFYLQYVLEVKPIETDRIVKGEVKHNVFDQINKTEEEIVKRISLENIKEIGAVYKQEYYKALMNSIQEKEEAIRKVGINKVELLEETWARLMQEAEMRAKHIAEFAQKNQLFGKELWDNLKPKYLTEVSIRSTNLKLRGRIDRVEVEEEKHTPIELKTGKMPQNGMWPGDRIQLGSYILLLQQQHKAEQGFLEYTEYSVRKKLVMDENLKEEIINLVEEVHDTVNKKELPRKICDERRCKNCFVREGCENLGEYAKKEREPYGYQGFSYNP